MLWVVWKLVEAQATGYPNGPALLATLTSWDSRLVERTRQAFKGSTVRVQCLRNFGIALSMRALVGSFGRDTGPMDLPMYGRVPVVAVV